MQKLISLLRPCLLDQPRASKEDVSYAVSCFLNIIVTPFVDMSLAARRLSSSIMVTEAINPSSPFVERVLRKRADAGGFSPSIYNAAYLGNSHAIFVEKSGQTSTMCTMIQIGKVHISLKISTYFWRFRAEKARVSLNVLGIKPRICAKFGLQNVTNIYCKLMIRNITHNI